MKLLKVGVLCALVSSFATPVLAEVTVTIPDRLTVLVANENYPEIKSGFLGANKTLILPNGTNQILFQYVPMFSSKNNDVKVYSDYIIATFDADNTELNIDLPQYRNKHDANLNIKQLDWSLVDSSSAKSVSVKQDVLYINGVTIGHDYIRDMEKYNRGNGLAAIASGPAPVQYLKSEGAVSTSANDLGSLQQQFLNMTLADRKAFLQWAVSQ